MPPGIGWWTSVSPLFDTPVYYVFGAICSVIGIINLVKLLKLPPKQAVDGKKPVW